MDSSTPTEKKNTQESCVFFFFGVEMDCQKVTKNIIKYTSKYVDKIKIKIWFSTKGRK